MVVDLRESVDGCLFRRDLHERLAEVQLVIPPMRDRPDDIVCLVKRLLDAMDELTKIAEESGGFVDSLTERVIVLRVPREAFEPNVLRVDPEGVRLLPDVPQSSATFICPFWLRTEP